MSKPFFVSLPNRGLITVSGEDRHDFLQGLITNDIYKLQSQPGIYACLLTPQGKFLYDFFVFETGNQIFLDCEGGFRAEALFKNLQMHKLHSKVELHLQGDIPIYGILEDWNIGMLENTHSNIPTFQHSNFFYPDPRHPDMGYRTLTKPDFEEKPFGTWDQLRLELGIPDGSRDMEVERSTLLECNIDKLGGVDWDKGCYMGQELTARMHHRGLAKRHLYSVKINGDVPPAFEDIETGGKKIGTMRSSFGNTGLALLKDDAVKDLKDDTNLIRVLG